MFAATNGHIIQVYLFYTAENPPELIFKGHSGKIRSIAWTHDDSGFVSAGWDGTVLEWQLYGPEPGYIQEFYQKGANFSSVDITGDGSHTIYCAGSDRILREVVGGNAVKQLEAATTIGHVRLTHTNSLLVAAVSEHGKPGSIRCYEFGPLTGDYSEYQAHSGPIERLAMAPDDTHIFTVGQDGIVCLFEIIDRVVTRAIAPKAKELASVMGFSEELIITETSIAELAAHIEA
jgi:WD40 repeat protein